MSSTPNPLEDNQKNSNDERMYSAIDAVMKNREQTYEDFVNSFSLLKKEDLVSKKPISTQTAESSGIQGKKMLQRVGELQAQTEELKPEDKSHDEMSHEDGKSPVLTEKTQANDIDELHEEVLEPGEVCGWMSQAGNQTSSVQFDNYLEDQGDDISDVEDTGIGYTASFAAGPSENANAQQSSVNAQQSSEDAEKNRQSPESLQETQSDIQQGTAQKSQKKKKKKKKSGKQTSANTGDNINRTDEGGKDNTPSAHESIETMKNILLETFLSDFCEEMGIGAMANMDFGSLPEMDLDENDEGLEGDDITFDEDPLELLMNITDTGSSTANTYIKESISKSNDNINADDVTEPNKKKKSRSRRRKKNKKSAGNSETSASNEAHSVSEDNKQTADKHTHGTGNVVNENNSESNMTPKSNGEVRNEENGIKGTVVPPEGEQVVSAFDEISVTEPKNSLHGTDTTEHSEETFSGKLLYPGEVDDDDTTTSVTKETRLEFKATYSDTTEDNSPSTTQDCSDDVEPFALDQDFDYDNVVLTPKYSPEDMERLSQLMTGKIIL